MCRCLSISRRDLVYFRKLEGSIAGTASTTGLLSKTTARTTRRAVSPISIMTHAVDVKALRNNARYIANLFFLPVVRRVRVKTSALQDQQPVMREYGGYRHI